VHRPKELARYLQELAANDERYQQHLAWKNEPYSSEFRALLQRAQSDIEPQCGICTVVHERLRAELARFPS